MSKSFDIPGGTAVFREQLTTERQRRPLKVAMMGIPDIIDIAKDLPEGMEDKTLEEIGEAMKEAGVEVDMTGGRAVAFLDVQDAVILAYLESWTLDRPLPKTMDEVLDLDSDLYDALTKSASEVYGTAKSPDVNTEVQPGLENPTDESSSSSEMPSTEEAPSQ